MLLIFTYLGIFIFNATPKKAALPPFGSEENQHRITSFNKMLTFAPFAGTFGHDVENEESRMSIEERLRGLGITIPKAMAPVASYVPTVMVDGMLYTSGSGPIVDGRPMVAGKLGGEVTVEQGYQAARLTAINLLARGWKSCRAMSPARPASIGSLRSWTAPRIC